ncbi:MAG: glycosyltransferase family 9 protein [Planctomycetes bacterium]|nr:glycosyltransferase family 9 protein [Planctomycetota bacterium]
MTSVLLVRLSAMGDLVHGLGAVEALHHVRPQWRLTFVTQPMFAPLLRGVPGIHRVVEFARRDGLRGVRRLRASLREDRYDVALDLQGNWKSAAVTLLSRAADRIGMAPSMRQEPMSAWLLRRRIRFDGQPHPARCALELVRAVAPEAPFWLPRLAPEPAEVEFEKRAVAAAGVNPERPFRVIVVTDPRDVRSLLPRVIEAETASSREPVLHLYGPAELALTPIADVPTLRHGPEPRRLIALGTVVARAGGVVLGPDQGATHVLSAAGARCLVWFGAQDPRRTAPPGAVALAHPDPPACSPCRADRCKHPSGRVCMEFGGVQALAAETGLPRPESRG